MLFAYWMTAGRLLYPGIARVSGEALAGVSLTCHS